MASDPGGNAIAMQLLLLVLLTLVNAFFAGAEMAIVSVNKNKDVYKRQTYRYTLLIYRL